MPEISARAINVGSEKDISNVFDQKKFLMSFVNDIRTHINRIIALTIEINNQCLEKKIDLPEMHELLLLLARLNQMVNGVFQIFRLSTKKISFNLGPVDVSQLIQKAIPKSILVNKAGQIVLETDETQLVRILENIQNLHEENSTSLTRINTFIAKNAYWIQIIINAKLNPYLEDSQKDVSRDFIFMMTSLLGGKCHIKKAMLFEKYIYSICLPIRS
jgi:hypothetical protein